MSTAHARFETNDADEIDQEVRLNSESYNDAKSYEHPYSWQRTWRQANIGYQVSAGSLNISKFLYKEDLKLIEVVPDVGMLTYTQERREDFLQQSHHSELRLAGYVYHDYYLGLIAEGGYFKKWADIGGVFGVGSPSGAFIEAKYYLVDYYYNEKEDTHDSYSRQPYAVSVAGRSEPSAIGFWEFLYEYDAPIQWHRDSEGYVYRRYSQDFSVDGVLPLTESLAILSKFEWERKTESKDWSALGRSASYERNVGTEDLGVNYAAGDSKIEYLGGTKFVYRRALYQYANPGLEALPAVSDSGVNPDSQRREIMPYLLVSKPVGDGQSHIVRGGPIWSYSLISENNDDAYANEVKLQAIYEFKIGKKISVLLNTNWDLDNLWVDAPYRETPFRPWDGGNIQVQAYF